MDLAATALQAVLADLGDMAAGTIHPLRGMSHTGVEGRTLQAVLDLLAQEDRLADRTEEDRWLELDQAQTSRST